MNCYKCKSTEDLSPKKIDQYGNITFMCKPCRRESRKKQPHYTNPDPAFNVKTWTIMAKENHRKLVEKYQDNSFLIAKGML